MTALAGLAPKAGSFQSPGQLPNLLGHDTIMMSFEPACQWHRLGRSIGLGRCADQMSLPVSPHQNRCAILTPPQAPRAAEPLRIRGRNNCRRIPASLTFVRTGSLRAGHARPLQNARSRIRRGGACPARLQRLRDVFHKRGGGALFRSRIGFVPRKGGVSSFLLSFGCFVILASAQLPCALASLYGAVHLQQIVLHGVQ